MKIVKTRMRKAKTQNELRANKKTELDETLSKIDATEQKLKQTEQKLTCPPKTGPGREVYSGPK